MVYLHSYFTIQKLAHHSWTIICFYPTFLVATRKDSSVVMVKLVLHRLSIFWNVGLDSLACCQDFFKGEGNGCCCLGIIFLFVFFLLANKTVFSFLFGVGSRGVCGKVETKICFLPSSNCIKVHYHLCLMKRQCHFR